MTPVPIDIHDLAEEVLSAQNPSGSPVLHDLFESIDRADYDRALRLTAQLSEFEYERQRDKIAKRLGMRATALDKIRSSWNRQQSDDQGRSIGFEDPEPAPEPQNGSELLHAVASQVRRFVAADASSIDALALWAVFAHIADRAPVSPLLALTSATRACGKSTALEVIARLVPKPLPASSVTPAALFRTVEKFQPTLLLDEADSIFSRNDELRTLCNAGFSKVAAQVVRVVGDDLEPRIFSVYTPKAIALIGRLPDTLESRSVLVRMRRRLPDEHIERLRADQDQGFSDLRSRIARYIQDSADAILAIDPTIPAGLSDRQADCWRELLRIADHAGGEWPGRARTAALTLCARQNDDGDLSVRLLADIARIFEEQPAREKWPSQALADELNSMEGAPWAELSHGKGLTTNRLARMLERFEVRPKQLREGAKTSKGYTRALFEDAFSRYLSSNRNNETYSVISCSSNKIQCSDPVNVSVANRNITLAEGSRKEALSGNVSDVKGNRNTGETQLFHDNKNNCNASVSCFVSERGTEKDRVSLSTEKLAHASRIVAQRTEGMPVSQYREVLSREGFTFEEIHEALRLCEELGLIRDGLIYPTRAD